MTKLAYLLALVDKDVTKANLMGDTFKNPVQVPGPECAIHDLLEMENPYQVRESLYIRAQQVSSPVDDRRSMMDGMTLKRSDILRAMGCEAAEMLRLMPTSKPKIPFIPESDIYYVLDLEDPSSCLSV